MENLLYSSLAKNKEVFDKYFENAADYNKFTFSIVSDEDYSFNDNEYLIVPFASVDMLKTL